jgi:hypothetical protein
MARITLSLEAAPSTPAAGTVVVYAKVTGGLWVKDEFSIERQIDLEINDSGTGTRELWSASKIISELAIAGGIVKAGIIPVGTKDGVNDTFSLPGGDSYRDYSLSVYLNGQQYDPANIVKYGPAYTSFSISGDTLPNDSLGDSFCIMYMLA